MDETPSSAGWPRSGLESSGSPSPGLPPKKAFVLQLKGDTGPTLEPFVGRVEHLSTGRRVRFTTLDEFLAALTRLLEETGQRCP
jgi:hypothetical protein